MEERRLEDEIPRNIGHVKVLNGWSNKSFNMLLELLRVVFPMFVEHQMLNTFKEFQGNCYRHFKKYSDPEEACANPPHLLVGRDKDRHFLYDRYMSCAFQKQSRTNKAARQKQLYNHSNRSKSFLQR
ncbi:CACTA en-spm transposon protein [Cucumis melo var. makuwa]|uniref:CACTA en-spm transposon protein n=1 Tax=Cucumis melo var. makuwa TaxID=1194695 RepID=A0A5D3BS43_CUCMM|nr:CACTA en-spm transposon protein [Cucumis melo var. makuwa]